VNSIFFFLYFNADQPFFFNYFYCRFSFRDVFVPFFARIERSDRNNSDRARVASAADISEPVIVVGSTASNTSSSAAAVAIATAADAAATAADATSSIGE
jgi:hypothetical protein